MRSAVHLSGDGRSVGPARSSCHQKTPLASPLPSVVTYHSLEYIGIHTNIRPGRPEAGFHLHMNRRSGSRSSLRGWLALANKSTTSTVLDVRRVQAEPYHYLRRPHSRFAGPQAVTPWPLTVLSFSSRSRIVGFAVRLLFLFQNTASAGSKLHRWHVVSSILVKIGGPDDGPSPVQEIKLQRTLEAFSAQYPSTNSCQWLPRGKRRGTGRALSGKAKKEGQSGFRGGLYSVLPVPIPWPALPASHSFRQVQGNGAQAG